LSPGSAGMLGREDRAGWLRHIRTQPTNEPDSRQAAKYAKVAKNGKHLPFAILCALASWRELFFQTLSRLGPSCPTSRGWFSARDLSHTPHGECKTTENITIEANMLLKTKERIVETT